MKRPTPRRAQTALDVLLWLSEITDDGQLRDEISHVRHELYERYGEAVG